MEKRLTFIFLTGRTIPHYLLRKKHRLSQYLYNSTASKIIWRKTMRGLWELFFKETTQ